MTEAGLEIVLRRGAWRLRVERALWAGLAAFGLGAAGAAGLIFLLRLFPLDSLLRPDLGATLPALALALPLLLAAAALSVVYFRYTPEPDTVALLLDMRAGTAEHLVTWYQLRRCAARAQDGELPRGFRAAQAAATLELGGRFDPRRLLPIRLPQWSRALWLALLLLCCALLMPPRARSNPLLDAAAAATQSWNAGGAGAGSNGAWQSSRSHTPLVQPLSQRELLIFRLKATDPNLPPAQKAEALKELLKKIGNAPENELSPEVRELLNALRNEVAVKDDNGKTGAPDGTKQLSANDASPAETAAWSAGVAQIPGFAERALATVEQNFGDVREQLEKYYRIFLRRDER